MSDLYEDILDKQKKTLIDSIIGDLQSREFNWNQLIELILEEDSPLLEVLSDKTVRLAEMMQAADTLYHLSLESKGES